MNRCGSTVTSYIEYRERNELMGIFGYAVSNRGAVRPDPNVSGNGIRSVN
jgi:hypothetical protein